MAVTAAMIKELRDNTGMGFSDCKKALAETDGNMEEAEMLLRKKGIDKAAKKADRTTGEGLILIERRGDDAVILEVMCEQEPTTGNDRFLAFVQMAKDAAFATGATTPDEMMSTKTSSGETLEEALKGLIGTLGENVQFKRMARVKIPAGCIFGQYIHFNKKAAAVCVVKASGNGDGLQELANDICMHSVAMRPVSLGRSGVPADLVEKEKEVFMEEVMKKPEQMREKIMEGKLGKFYSEKCLLEQLFVKDAEGKRSVQKVLEDTAKAAGVTAEVIDWKRLELGV